MIVHALSCENLLKYRRLALDELPDRGVIAISGQNESGKSSIGECICFALFGRTFAVGQDEVGKLIRWGESSCSASLDFGVGDGVRYRVTRFLDRDGNHSARLCREDDLDRPLARGGTAVADALVELLGYRVEEFVESFYLAQREITTPHPHSHAVKVMAGIAPLEHSRNEFRDELAREHEALDNARARAAEMVAQLEDLGFDAAGLERMEARRRELAGQVAELQSRREALLGAATDYQAREPQLRATEGSRRTASGLRFLFLLLALLALGAWGALTRLGEQPLVQQAASALQQGIPGWQPLWLLYAGAGLAVVFLLLWIRVAALNGRIRSLRGAGTGLTAELAALDALEAGLPEEARSDLGVEQGGDADGESGETPALRVDPEIREHLHRRVDQGEATAEEVRVAAEHDGAWLEQAAARVQRHIGELDSDIGRERARGEEHAKLQGLLGALEHQQIEHEQRVRVRELADELLLAASRHLSHRFNHDLRGLAGKTLPLFTDGRYEHLQIDEDLTVRAFSSEKRDFMDLDEISSGTQRQIMLALRLALSQELINRVVQGPQFVFLDEPFAFFDEQRTRSALSVLPGLSDEIAQIWIVAQQFPEDMELDLRIACRRDADALVSTGA